jgi:DNA-binding response OmpR family regulator
MQGAKILVVDDDADVRGLVRALLERAGAHVREAASGRDALRELFAAPPEAVVLDVSMPGLDGWATLERIREVSVVPVLMLTAHGGELEKVRGLQTGADDYVTKPFGRQELIARIGALLRRAAGTPAGGGAAAPEVYEDDLLHVDLTNAVVRAGASEVHLTPLELRLLATFVRNPGQVLSRELLLERVWGSAHVGVEQVKLNVGTLRRKLQAAIGEEPAPIETVRGFGWRLTRRRA